MRAFADHQPLTVMIDSVRALTEGAAASGLAHSPEHYEAISLAWAAGIVVVFAPIAIRRYWKHS